MTTLPQVVSVEDGKDFQIGLYEDRIPRWPEVAYRQEGWDAVLTTYVPDEARVTPSEAVEALRRVFPKSGSLIKRDPSERRILIYLCVWLWPWERIAVEAQDARHQ